MVALPRCQSFKGEGSRCQNRNRSPPFSLDDVIGAASTEGLPKHRPPDVAAPADQTSNFYIQNIHDYLNKYIRNFK